MQTLTFFASKGGAGRTTAVMALASAFIELGKRVLVLDATDQVRPCSFHRTTTLQDWEDTMVRCGVSAFEFNTAQASCPQEIADRLAKAKSNGIDIVLIDTAARPDALSAYAINLCDLLIVPFCGALEAQWASEGLRKHGNTDAPLYGLPTGLTGTAVVQQEARDAFGAGPLLQNELPSAEIFAMQSVNGHLPQMLADWPDAQSDNPLEGFADAIAAKAAWGACLQIACELDWLSRGWQIRKIQPPYPLQPLSFANEGVPQ